MVIPYDEKLKAVQILACADDLSPDFEEEMISIHLNMLELKTEIDILEKGNRHRSS